MIEPLIISGPSGIGKNFLVEQLKARYQTFDYVVTPTTREIRPGEVEGVDYYFLNPEQYAALQVGKDLFMDNLVFGNRYGFCYSDVNRIIKAEKIPVASVTVSMVDQFLKAYPQSETLFLYPANLELLAHRMRKRGDKEESIAKRLADIPNAIAGYEQNAHWFKEVVHIKDDSAIELAIEKIAKFYNLNQ